MNPENHQTAFYLPDGSMQVITAQESKGFKFACIEMIMSEEYSKGPIFKIRKMLIQEVNMNGSNRKVLRFTLPEEEVMTLALALIEYANRKSSPATIAKDSSPEKPLRIFVCIAVQLVFVVPTKGTRQ